MKVKLKAGGNIFNVEFGVAPTKDGGLITLAKSSNDLDKLEEYISTSGAGDDPIRLILAREIEKQLKLPVDIDYSHNGAGYSFKFDMFAIAKQLK
tara:strand:+ start:826 stop:1110 length:285 start_codon:yes stop_codon:yes gene_type:complete